MPRCVCVHHLVGLVVKVLSTSRAAQLGSSPTFTVVLSPLPVIPVTCKLALQGLPCLAPTVIGSAVGLVGPVSVYFG